MKRNANFFKATAALVMTGVVATVFTSCTKSTTVEPSTSSIPTYSVSGSVMDGSGNNNNVLSGTVVSAGGFSEVMANDNGTFEVDGIPYGDRAFTFMYLDTAATPVDYTTASFVIDGENLEEVSKTDGAAAGNGSDTTEVFVIADQAGKIMLYPLDGAVTGKIMRQAFDGDVMVPAEGVTVNVSFVANNNGLGGSNDFQNVTISPNSFSAVTDDKGVYTITGLPVSSYGNDDILVTVNNTIDAEDNYWQFDRDNNNVQDEVEVQLTRGTTVPVEQIVLDRIDGDANGIELVTTASFLDASKKPQFGLDKATPITVSFVKDINVTDLNVVVADRGDLLTAKSTNITVAVATNTITITPNAGLWDETKSTHINISGTLSDGTIVTIEDQVLNFANENAQGLDLIASASFLTANKTEMFDISKSDDLVVTFNSDVTAADLQVNVAVGATKQDITVAVVDGTVTATPVSGTWKGTPTLEIVGTLVDGKVIDYTSAALNFENDLDIIKSNVTVNNDLTTAIEGIEVDQAIELFANQDVVKVIARLYKGATVAGGEEISSTVAVDATDLTKITVTPSMQMQHNAGYSLRLTVFNADGESNVTVIENFVTEQNDLYVAASSTLDVNGNAIENYDLFTPITLTFNMPLDADLNKIVWGAPTAWMPGGAPQKTINGDKNSTDLNSTVSLDETGTILTILVDNRENIKFGDQVGFGLTVFAENGEKLDGISYVVGTAPMDDYLVSSNAKDSLGFNIEMGPSEAIVAHFGFDIAALDFAAGNVVLKKGAVTQDQPLSSEIAFEGDSITYTPRLPLDEGGEYSLVFTEVELTNGMKDVTLATIDWEVTKGGIVATVDNTANGEFRALAPVGGEFTVTFDKAIDPARPITVTGFCANYTTVVSADNMSVTVTAVDVLNLQPFDTDYSDKANAIYANVVVSAKTSTDLAVGGAGTGFPIFTEEGLFCVDASYAKVNNASIEVDGATSVVDEYAIADAITLTFTREIDATTLADGIMLNVEEDGAIVADVPATVTLDATNKIVTIAPTTALTLGSYFTVQVTADLAGVGIDGAGNGNAAPFTSTEVLTGLSTSKDLSTLAVTAIAATADNKRDWNNDGATNFLNFDLTRPAWNVDYRDSVSYYNVVAKNGTEGVWADSVKLAAETAEYSVFGTSTVSTTGEVDGSLTQVNTDALFPNTISLFATGDSITLKAQSVYIDTIGYEPDGPDGGTAPDAVIDTVFGTWSNELVLGDNTPSADSTIGIGATFAKTGLASFNRGVTGPAVDADSMVITVTFDEDMDISVKPSAVELLKGSAVLLADAQLTVTAGEWISARTYVQTIQFPAVSAGGTLDLTYGDGATPATGWGYNVNVEAFKDLSGNLNDGWGVFGSGGVGTDIDASGRIAGSKSVQVPRNN